MKLWEKLEKKCSSFFLLPSISTKLSVLLFRLHSLLSITAVLLDELPLLQSLHPSALPPSFLFSHSAHMATRACLNQRSEVTSRRLCSRPPPECARFIKHLIGLKLQPHHNHFLFPHVFLLVNYSLTRSMALCCCGVALRLHLGEDD